MLDDVQTRLVLLYALRSFQISMSTENLMKLVVWNGILDYFTMMDYLLDMKNIGMVKTIVIEDETRYDITPKGMQSVELFSKKIPLSIRDRIDDTVELLQRDMNRPREISADIVPLDRRRFLAKCGIYEKNVPLLEINLLAGTRTQAEESARRFEKEAGSLYTIILDKIVEHHD